MVKKIRMGVFETNSSSSHSIVLQEKKDFRANGGFYHAWFNEDIVMADIYKKKYNLDVNKIDIYPGRFNWDVNIHRDAETKASYIYTYALYLNSQIKNRILDRLKRVICKYMDREIDINFKLMDGDYPEGHIDHQSINVCDRVVCNDDRMYNFLFNHNVILLIDNDNR